MTIRAVAVAIALVFAARASAADRRVTFARDVAPILQARCQLCHRPGAGAPMSLVTYNETRPWAKAIKERVTRRDMPPWGLDRHQGIQYFKNDRSLTLNEIDLIARWADGGAPFGQASDLPPPVSWPDASGWQTGTPDVILSLPPRTIAAAGPDAWTDFIVDTGFAEDRYIRAVETKPSIAARSAVHHVVTFLAQDDGGAAEAYLSEYAVGKDGESFPDGAGRLIRAGARLHVNVHDHPIGRPVAEETQIGLFLYPKGTVPRRGVTAITVGLSLLDDDLDIPANSIATHHVSARLAKSARIISFQPHMHMRGKAMTLEAMYPNGAREMLGAVDRFDFGSQVAYIFAEAAQPVLPAGTVLHAVATYDNTAANRNNPDPNQWVGFGNRAVDEMFQCHVLMTDVEDRQ